MSSFVLVYAHLFWVGSLVINVFGYVGSLYGDYDHVRLLPLASANFDFEDVSYYDLL